MDIELNAKEVTTAESKDNFVKIIDFLIRELAGESFELEANIIDNNNFTISISGIPGSTTRKYRINFDLGVFKMIYDVLYVILSNKSFFPTIGETSGTVKIPTLDVPNWAYLDMAIANNDAVYFDQERKELHHYIYTLCLHFLARHEIRHIANGHIDYLADKMDVRLFFESAKNGLTPLDSQTLEMDVDSCVFVGFLNGFLNVPGQLAFVPVRLQDKPAMFESLFFALKVLFYCLPSKKITGREGIENESHPNSTLRYFFSFTAGLSFIQELHPELFETFGKAYQESWSFFEILAEQGIFDFEVFLADYNWSMSGEGQAYAHEIWNNWNHWFPKLEPYAYLKLAPPEQN